MCRKQKITSLPGSIHTYFRSWNNWSVSSIYTKDTCPDVKLVVTSWPSQSASGIPGLWPTLVIASDNRPSVGDRYRLMPAYEEEIPPLVTWMS